ncbi:MAG: hypothetical protein K2M31_01065 [Muribaculaceae bacterium]|nr:hypothetical protein [Muribaculaceae bacterium]
MKIKKVLKGMLAVAAVATITLASQSFTTNAKTDVPSSYNNVTFVKTHARCGKSNCSCSGYWGYKHQNGTYEGACSNTDGHGHTCGHSPQSHGLRAW